MPGYVGVILFFTLFFGVGAFIFIASSRERKRWLARPAILRALATRRGYRIVENPGKPSELIPIRPLEKAQKLTAMELPVAVHGRTIDGDDFTIFDVYTEQKTGFGSNVHYQRSYETFITIKSGDRKWPHFEFAAVADPKPGSFTVALLAMTGNLAELLLKDRGLVHVPIPEHPGYQLFVGDQHGAEALRDTLVRLFANRTGWWVGALDDALTVQRRASNSATAGSLVAESELDRFIDEAIAIQRDLSSATRR